MDFIFWLLSYVVPFLAVLTIIVFVHEMGHYLVARWNGIAIQTFSIGFGPEADRLQRPARHALAPVGHSAGRLRPLRRRHERREHARRGVHRQGRP